MRIVILFILPLFIRSCLCEHLTGTNITLKVVGGFDCHPKLLPYLASVQTDRHSVFCGGSLINSLWTLTAAHCCSRKFNNYTVWTGLTDLRRQFVQWSSVKRMIPHENFSIYPWSNDICLLELETPLEETRYTKYVRLITPAYYETLMVNTRCNRSLALGFGYRRTVPMERSAESNSTNTVLQCVFQRVMQDKYCDVANISVDTTTMLCVHGNPEETSDTCMASVQTDTHSVFCGGSLINPLWTLTAAHCCSTNYSKYTVWTGLTDLRRQYVQWAWVKRMIPHENFTERPWSNDICLLELERPLKETRYTKYVRLITPSKYETLMVNMRCNRSLALGFGYRSTVYKNLSAKSQSAKTVLQCVFQRVMQDKYCDVANISVDATTMLCVHGNPKVTSDTCMGDSGGPLLCQGYQIGIVAAGLGCGLGYRSYFTKTAIFQDFIERYVSNNIIISHNTSATHTVYFMYLSVVIFYLILMAIVD